VQLLITSLLARGGLAFALDKGGSYSKLCRETGNQMINAATLYLNPFSHLDYEAMKRDPDLINDPDISVDAMLENSLAMITELYAMIGRPREGASDLEKTFLNRCITAAYHKKQTKTLVDDVVFEIEQEIEADRVSGAPFDRRKQDWAKEYLKGYMTTGSSPDVFNKPSKLDPKANFICIETEGVPINLKNPVIMALTIDIDNRIILSESSREKIFVIEEVATTLKHLKSAALSEKIEEGAATYRKKGACILGVAQAVKEFYDTPLLQILYTKAVLKVIMLQGSGFSVFAKNEKLFTDAEIDQIARFKPSSEARFASFLLQNGQASSVHHIYLDPYTKVLTSTKNQEMAAIKTYRKQGLSDAEAVEKVMWEYYGDEARELEAWRESQAKKADVL
jgi:conjugal transfer ATP-binding protein TraC